MSSSSKLSASVARLEYLPFGRPDFGDEEIAAVARVLRSGWVGMGPEVIAFELELAAFLGAKHVVTVNSCTSAMHLALIAAGVGPGDEVIVPSLTWCSTANAALYTGAKPVFCDVDRKTLNITPDSILAALTPKTRAVIAVHFGGLAADVAQLRAALPTHVSIIEDAAHALGARYPNGQQVGSSGNAVCFSFYANKNLSTGEGGAVALADASHAALLRTMRQHGLPTDAWKRFTDPSHVGSGQISQLGFKANYNDLQASIGRVQLRRQTEFVKRRLEVAVHYQEHLSSVAPGCSWQQGLTNPEHSRHLFVLLTPPSKGETFRDVLLISLRKRNIGASIHYSPLHQMPFYSGFKHSSLRVTEDIAPRLLTLPISGSMSLVDAEDVIRALKNSWTDVLFPPIVAKVE